MYLIDKDYHIFECVDVYNVWKIRIKAVDVAVAYAVAYIS